jgi:hypothetical protein
MIHVDQLHDLGYTGDGMRIAVMDAGFRGVDTIDVLSHLWINNKIIDEYDFVRNQPNNFNTHSTHGSSVLMCMAANSPGFYVGSAPDAEYLLIRTEDAPTENIIEEYNWAAGAEFADSAGADVFNTSLGYTTFDNPDHDHTYDDLDGNTTVITIASDIAASKGILVINSAGNSGNNAWYYIGAPADGDSVLAIGAVHGDEIITSFSSRGPSADGRIKPNVMAMGGGVPMPVGNGKLTFINGTSFSSPILAGAAACLWQSQLGYTNMDIFNAIEQSAHLSQNPNNDYGYGIPNMYMAHFMVTGVEEVAKSEASVLYPNPAQNWVSIIGNSTPMDITIYNSIGQLVLADQQVSGGFDVSSLTSGVYMVTMQSEQNTLHTRLVIHE